MESSESRPHSSLTFWRDDPLMNAMEEDPEGDWVRREVVEDLIGAIDELDSVLECYATGGFDNEAQFVVELERVLNEARGSNPAKRSE